MITMIVELSCDQDGCDVAYAPTPAEMTSVRATRVGGMIAGWTRFGATDYCPEHAQSSLIDSIRTLAGRRQTDDRIAASLGVSRNTVLRLRRDNDIPPGLGRVGRPSASAR